MSRERPVRADFADRSVKPVLAAVRERALEYSLVRKLPDGAWGAWLVVDGRGSHAVLKCVWDADWSHRLAGAARVVDALAARGARVPRYLLSGYEPGLGTWYVQEYVPGERVRTLTPALVADVIDFNALQAGLAKEAPGAFDWPARLARRLYDDAAPERRFPEAAAALRALEPLFEPYRGRPLGGEDVVHGDFLVTQLLADAGRLVSVVDWDAAGCGDRGQDLAMLFYNAFANADRLGEEPPGAAVSLLGRRALGVCGAEAFGVYVASAALDALRFVAERNPKHVAWRASLATRAAAAYRRLATAS